MESTTTVAAGDIDSAEALCPARQALVMGQYESTGADSEVFDLSDFGVRNSIVAALDNFDSSVSATVTAIGYCVASGHAVIARSRAQDHRILTRRANRAETRRRAADLAAPN